MRLRPFVPYSYCLPLPLFVTASKARRRRKHRERATSAAIEVLEQRTVPTSFLVPPTEITTDLSIAKTVVSPLDKRQFVVQYTKNKGARSDPDFLNPFSLFNSSPTPWNYGQPGYRTNGSFIELPNGVLSSVGINGGNSCNTFNNIDEEGGGVWITLFNLDPGLSYKAHVSVAVSAGWRSQHYVPSDLTSNTQGSLPTWVLSPTGTATQVTPTPPPTAVVDGDLMWSAGRRGVTWQHVFIGRTLDPLTGQPLPATPMGWKNAFGSVDVYYDVIANGLGAANVCKWIPTICLSGGRDDYMELEMDASITVRLVATSPVIQIPVPPPIAGLTSNVTAYVLPMSVDAFVAVVSSPIGTNVVISSQFLPLESSTPSIALQLDAITTSEVGDAALTATATLSPRLISLNTSTSGVTTAYGEDYFAEMRAMSEVE